MKKTSHLIIGAFFLLSTIIYSQNWSVKKQLTYTDGLAWHLALAADTIEGIHMAYMIYNISESDIFYKGSTGWGSVWLNPNRLCWNSGESEEPDIAIDSTGRKHVVWMDTTPPPSGNKEIFYKHKHWASTAPWSPLIRISWTSDISRKPAISVDSNDCIHIVWMDKTPGNFEIFYKNSTNSGGDWSTTQRLTWNSNIGFFPNVAITIDSSDIIHVVWLYQKKNINEFIIHHKFSLDGGNNWSSVNRLSLPSDDCRDVDIAADSSGAVHVVWTKMFSSGQSDIIYRKSIDGGSTWTASQRLTWTAEYAWGVKIASDLSGGIHIVYRDNSPGNDEIFYKESTDRGATWLAPTRLTWNSSESQYPQIVSDKDGGIHVAWNNETVTTASHEIFYRNKIIIQNN